jgi:hypothetical protein
VLQCTVLNRMIYYGVCGVVLCNVHMTVITALHG